MGQALYRKYRSKHLNEIVGQEHITATLARAIETNRLSHAYLFTGPRGVGKTSIARIFAHDINGLPYDDDSSHIDIIEIDAASNGRIEEIRDLRERVYVAPALARYKVYIIDEVHMVSTAGFNGLLKTLEEPPEHVVFILATTDAQKVPPTVISRTQRFQFQPIETPKVVKHLAYIADQEKINIEPAALEIIAAHGQGSFRDSISLLDQAANYSQPVTEDTIRQLLGLLPDQLVIQLIEAVAAGRLQTIAQLLTDFRNRGYPPSVIASQLSQQLRSQLLDNKSVLNQSATISLLETLLEVPASRQPDQFLELALLKSASVEAEPTPAIAPAVQSATPAATIDQTKSKPQPTKSEPAPAISTKTPPKQTAVKTKPKEDEAPTEQSKPSDLKTTKKPLATANGDFTIDQWPTVLELLKKSYNTLYGLVRMAVVDLDKPGTVIMQFPYQFHQKQINVPKNKQAISDAIAEAAGVKLVVECIVDPSLLAKKSTTKPASEPAPDLSAITSVFGSTEVL